MNEQAPQEQAQPVTASQLIDDLESKGAKGWELVPTDGSEGHRIVAATEPTINSRGESTLSSVGTSEIEEGNPANPQDAGIAHTSTKKDGLAVRYEGHIAPMDAGYSQPRVSRGVEDPKYAENVVYQHKFKDAEKAGQLIAKLTAKRIERINPGEEHKAA